MGNFFSTIGSAIGKVVKSGAKKGVSATKKGAVSGYKYASKRRKRKKQQEAGFTDTAETAVAKKVLNHLMSLLTTVAGFLVPLLLDLLPWILGIVAGAFVMATVIAAVSVKQEEVRIPAAAFQEEKVDQDSQLLQGLKGGNGQIFFNTRTNHYEMAEGKTPTGLNKLYFVYYATEAENSKWFVEYTINSDNEVVPVKQYGHLSDTVDGYLFNQSFVPEILAPKVISSSNLASEEYDFSKIFTERTEAAIDNLSMSADLMYLLDNTLNQENNGLSSKGFFFAEQFAKPVYHYTYDPDQKDPATGKAYSYSSNSKISEYTEEEDALEASQNGTSSSDYTSVPYIAYQTRPLGTYVSDTKYKSTAGKGTNTTDPTESKKGATKNYDQSHVNSGYNSSLAHGDKYNSLAEAEFLKKYKTWTNEMDAENLAEGGTSGTNVTASSSTSDSSTTSTSTSSTGSISVLNSVLGKLIGNGQCYALSSYYVNKLTGGVWSLGAGISGKKLSGPDEVDAKAIGGLDWSSITGSMAGKFKVITDPSYSQLKAGDIVNFDGGPVDPTAGHTAVISSVDGNDYITVYTQNPKPVSLEKFKITSQKIGASYSLSEFHISSVVTVDGSGGSSSSSSSTTSLDATADPSAIYPKEKGIYNGKYDTGELSAWTREYDTSYSPTVLQRYQLQSDVKQLLFRSGDFWIATKDRKAVPVDVATLTNETGNTLETSEGIFKKANDIGSYLSDSLSDSSEFSTSSESQNAISGGSDFTKPAQGTGSYLNTNETSSVRDAVVDWSIANGYNPNFIVALVVGLTNNGSKTFSGGKYDFADDGGAVGTTNTSNAEYSSKVASAISSAGSGSVSYSSSSSSSTSSTKSSSTVNFNDITQSLDYLSSTYLAPAIETTKTSSGNLTDAQIKKVIDHLAKAKYLKSNGESNGTKGGMSLSNTVKDSIIRYEKIFNVKQSAATSSNDYSSIKLPESVLSNLSVYTYDEDTSSSDSGSLGDSSKGSATSLSASKSYKYPYGQTTASSTGTVGYLDPASGDLKVPVWAQTVEVEPIQVVGRVNQQGNGTIPDGASKSHPYAIVRNGTAAAEDSSGNLKAGTQVRKATASSSAKATASDDVSSDEDDSVHKLADESVSDWVKDHENDYNLTTAEATADLIKVHKLELLAAGKQADSSWKPTNAAVKAYQAKQTTIADAAAKIAIDKAKDEASEEDADDATDEGNDPSNGAGIVYEKGLGDYGFGTIYKVISTKWEAVNVQVQSNGTAKVNKYVPSSDTDERYELMGVSSPFGSIDLSKEMIDQKEEVDDALSGTNSSLWQQLMNDASMTTTISAKQLAVLKEHEDTSLTPASGYDFVVTDKPVIAQSDISLKNMFGIDYLKDYLENYSTYVPNSLVSPTDISKRYTEATNPQLSNQTADDQVARIWNQLIGTSSSSSSSTTSSSTSADSTNAVAKKIYQYLTSNLGFSSAGAAGALAVAQRESDFDPKANNSSGGVHGIYQWSGWSSTVNGNRWASAPSGKVDTLSNELALMSVELKGSYNKAATTVGVATNSESGAVQAAEDWSEYYEGVSLSDSQSKLSEISEWAKQWYDTETDDGKNVVSANTSKLGTSSSSSSTSTDVGTSTSTAVGVSDSWGNGLSLVDEIKESITSSGFFNSVAGLFSKSYNSLEGGAMFSSTDIYNNGMVLANGSQIVKNTDGSYSMESASGTKTQLTTAEAEYYLGIYKAVKQSDGTYKYKLDDYAGVGGDKLYSDGYILKWPFSSDGSLQDSIVHQHISSDSQTVGDAIIGGADAFTWTKYTHHLSNSQAEYVIDMWIASLESRDERPVYANEVNSTFSDYDLGRIVENHYASQLAAVFATNDDTSSSSTTSKPSTTDTSTPVNGTKKVKVLAVKGYIKYNGLIEYNPGIIIDAGGGEVDSIKAGTVTSVGSVSGTVPGGISPTTVTIQSSDGTDTMVYVGVNASVSTGDTVKAGDKIGTASNFILASTSKTTEKYGDVHLTNIDTWNDPINYFGDWNGAEITMIDKLNGYNPNVLGSSNVPKASNMKAWPVEKNGETVTWDSSSSSTSVTK